MLLIPHRAHFAPSHRVAQVIAGCALRTVHRRLTDLPFNDRRVIAVVVTVLPFSAALITGQQRFFFVVFGRAAIQN